MDGGGPHWSWCPPHTESPHPITPSVLAGSGATQTETQDTLAWKDAQRMGWVWGEGQGPPCWPAPPPPAASAPGAAVVTREDPRPGTEPPVPQGGESPGCRLSPQAPARSGTALGDPTWGAGYLQGTECQWLWGGGRGCLKQLRGQRGELSCVAKAQETGRGCVRQHPRPCGCPPTPVSATFLPAAPPPSRGSRWEEAQPLPIQSGIPKPD